MSYLIVVLLLLVIAATGLVALRSVTRRRGRAERPLPPAPVTPGELFRRTRQALRRPGVPDKKPRGWPVPDGPGEGDGSGAVAYGGREPAWPGLPAGQQALTEAVPLGLAGRKLTGAALESRELAGRELAGGELSRVREAAVTSERPPGLAVTAVSSPGALSQDVYYVQGNVIALARSLRPAGIDQRAAALALSAVLSSPLGRGDAQDALRRGVSAANRLVRSVSTREPGYSDMVTTLDIVYFAAERRSVHVAHVGNSSVWLKRAGSPSVELLSEVHSINGGPLLRAVGLSPDIVADITKIAVQPGDRIFLTTASPTFSFSPDVVDSVVSVMALDPVDDCAAALASLAPAGESITVVAAEIGWQGMFRS